MRGGRGSGTDKHTYTHTDGLGATTRLKGSVGYRDDRHIFDDKLYERPKATSSDLVFCIIVYAHTVLVMRFSYKTKCLYKE